MMCPPPLRNLGTRRPFSVAGRNLSGKARCHDADGKGSVVCCCGAHGQWAGDGKPPLISRWPLVSCAPGSTALATSTSFRGR